MVAMHNSQREARLRSRPVVIPTQRAAWRAVIEERDGDMPLEARRRFLSLLGDIATPDQWEAYWNLELLAQSERIGSDRMKAIGHQLAAWDAYYAELDADGGA